MLDIDLEYRGSGPAGALAYAGLGELVRRPTFGQGSSSLGLLYRCGEAGKTTSCYARARSAGEPRSGASETVTHHSMVLRSCSCVTTQKVRSGCWYGTMVQLNGNVSLRAIVWVAAKPFNPSAGGQMATQQTISPTSHAHIVSVSHRSTGPANGKKSEKRAE